MSQRGRPTKLTPELQHIIVKAVRAGNYMETAAAFAGLHKSTLYDWLKRGAREKDRVSKDPRLRIRKSELPFVEFSDALEKALAEAEVRDVAIIGKAAEEQWQAAAWRLERKFPERWGRKEQIQHEGKVTVERNDEISQAVLQNPRLAELATEFFAELATHGLGQDDAGRTGESGESSVVEDASSPATSEP